MEYRIKFKNVFLILILIPNTLLIQLLCQYGFPDGCVQFKNVYDLYQRLTNLIINTAFIFYINKTHKHVKLNKEYIFLFFVSIISNLTFSYISSVDVFKSSLNPKKSGTTNYNAYATTLYALIFSIPTIIITYNFIKHTRPKLKEIIPRIFITVWYTLWSVLLYTNMDNLHLHHRFFSFICCLWCYQKQFIIKMLFFIALGIFIQGSLVYPYTELIDSYELNTNTMASPIIIQNTNTSVIVKEVIVYKCEYTFEQMCEICFEHYQ